MKRIAITHEGESNGWFNVTSATCYEEDTNWDGSNHISCATGSQWDHEQLYRTSKGAWVLNHWSQWQGSHESYVKISKDDAAAWLVKNGHNPDDAVLTKQMEAQEV